MPEILIRNIDASIVERVKVLAKQRGWSINDVLLSALRQGLGMGDEHAITSLMVDSGSVILSGHWDAQERAIFQEALRALAVAPQNQLAAQSSQNPEVA